MIKKYIFTCGLMAASVLAVSAASDRLDVFSADSTFKSIPLSDMLSLTNIKEATAADGDGYTYMRVTYRNGEVADLPMRGVDHILYKAVDETPHGIYPVDIDHARFTMLYNHNKPDHPDAIDPTKPYGWRGSVADGPVFYLLDVDKGFDAEHSVVGAFSGKVYSDTRGFVFTTPADANTQYGIGMDCLTFLMPYEDVEMYLTCTERTTYAGKGFLGTYKGVALALSAPLTALDPDATAELELKANGTYQMTSIASDEYDFIDYFTYDEETGRMAYVPQTLEEKQDNFVENMKYGVTANFKTTDVAFARIDNLETGRPEDTRYFLLSRGAYHVAYATSEGAQRQLVQLWNDVADSSFWLIDSYGSNVHDAQVEFVSGSTTISEPCVALVSFEGKTQIKVINEQGRAPQFVVAGREAGVYDQSNGSSTLTLDGFGGAQLDGTDYTYTIEGGVVTIIIGGEPHRYTIDTDSHAFTETVSDIWTGGTCYTLETATGAYETLPESSDNIISLAFDKNLLGNDYEGYAALSIKLKRNDGFGNGYKEIISACPKYVYDAAASKITLTNVLVGAGKTGTTRINLVVNVSDDLRTMWFDDATADRIYSIDNTGSYVLTGTVNTLTTDWMPAAPSLTTSYSGSLSATYFGMNMEVTTTLDFDKDASGADKPGYAYLKSNGMGSDIIADCVEYETDDTTVTLKNVTVGNGDQFSGMTEHKDITFTLRADGSLLGEGVFYGSTLTTAGIAVDFASAPLMPAE